MSAITVTIWVRPVPSLCPNILPEKPHKTVVNSYRCGQDNIKGLIFIQVSHFQVQQSELKSVTWWYGRQGQKVLFYMQEAGSGLGLLDGWDVGEVGLNTSREGRSCQAGVHHRTIRLHCPSVCNCKAADLICQVYNALTMFSYMKYIFGQTCVKREGLG